MILNSVSHAVFVAAAFRCAYCRVQTYIDLPRSHPLRATIDHIKPRSKGGTEDRENLCCCCFRCNQDKADLTEDEFAAYRRSTAVPGRAIVRSSGLYAKSGRSKIVPFVQNHALMST